MKIRNLTPHKIDFLIQDDAGSVDSSNGTSYRIRITIKSEGSARCKINHQVIDMINGIDVIIPKFGAIEGLPKKEENTIIIASRIVAEAAKSKGRDDVYCIGETLRDGSFILGALNIVKP